MKKRTLGIVLCVATFVSLLLKPSFFQVFAPMLAVVFVMDFVCERRNLKEYIIDSAVFLPSVILIMYQAVESLLSPTAIKDGGGVEFAFLEVWNFYSNNILLSILSVTIFPIFVGVFCEKKFTDNKPLLYAFVFYVIAVMEAALLAESGSRKFHANFWWGMNLAIGILFYAAILTFERYLRTFGTKQSVAYKSRKYAGYALLLAHFGWGVWYYHKLLFATFAQCF